MTRRQDKIGKEDKTKTKYDKDKDKDKDNRQIQSKTRRQGKLDKYNRSHANSKQ